MKNSIFLILIILFLGSNLIAQVNLKDLDLDKTYIIYTHDGAEFVGQVVSFDKKEVLINTIKLGEISVPAYQIKEIIEATQENINASGDIIMENIFATRYFITTNGLDIKKGDSYILFNWYGPDIQFGVADNWTVGLMSSWLATPIIGTVKYSMSLGDNVSLGLGALVGTLGWTAWDTGGALPYAAITYGDRRTNINFSAGYGAIWYESYDFQQQQDVARTEGEALISLAGMRRLNNSFSFVFDSFIIPGLSDETPTTAILIPGIRIQRKEGFAFQFGLSGIYTKMGEDGYGFIPFPLPMVQLYWKI
jgi:hypothetical protein